MSPVDRPGLAEAAADVVRAASRRQRLATCGDVLEGLGALGLLGAAEGAAGGPDSGANEGAQVLALLPGLLAQHPDLACFEGLSGQTLYHAPELLSGTYARILDRKGSPLQLMAEEIRLNSREYPRPVPVELFEAEPFGLSPEEIAQALRAMADSPEFQDITFTATPEGAVYLFSSRHLERGYAEFLARQAEAQVRNP